MTFGSSAGYSGYKQNCDFSFGTSYLPYWASEVEGIQNSIIGGASLWVFEGHSKEEYKGVAEFFSYLSSAEVQADWHQFTGYLPITYAAYDLTKAQGFYDANPGTETALIQMTTNQPTPIPRDCASAITTRSGTSSTMSRKPSSPVKRQPGRVWTTP